MSWTSKVWFPKISPPLTLDKPQPVWIYTVSQAKQLYVSPVFLMTVSKVKNKFKRLMPLLNYSNFCILSNLINQLSSFDSHLEHVTDMMYYWRLTNFRCNFFCLFVLFCISLAVVWCPQSFCSSNMESLSFSLNLPLSSFKLTLSLSGDSHVPWLNHHHVPFISCDNVTFWIWQSHFLSVYIKEE